MSENEDKALEYFFQAISILEDAEGELTNTQRRDVISLLSLAVKYADNVFPRANSLLAMIHYENQDTKAAKKFAQLALEQDEDEFRAQFVQVQLAIDDVQVLTGSASSLLPQGIGAKHILGSLFRAGKAAVTAGQVTATQVKFKNEVAKLVDIFNRTCTYEGFPVTEFIYYSEQLMSLMDFVLENQIPMPGGKPNVYAMITQASTTQFEYDEEYKNEQLSAVNQIQRLAEGRALSFR